MADSTNPTSSSSINSNSNSNSTSTSTSTSTTTPTPAEPITLHIPPSLQQYAVPASTYLSTLEGTGPATPSIIAASGIIIVASATRPKTLLIRRADSGGMASRWEPPGGGIEASDPTVLHGVAREVWEETGLHVRRVRALAAGARTGTVPYTFSATRSGRVYLKLNFLVEVVEGGATAAAAAAGGGEEEEEEEEEEEVQVRLDPEEHTEWRWVAEEELDGFEITSPTQLGALRDAFEVHRSGV